jgi:hypothetical protein
MKRKALALTFILLLLVSTMVGVTTVHFSTAQTGTEVSSVIGSNTTWTQANSPYYLLGPTLVSSGVTLTIEAGATVNLNTYYLQVNGTLIITGTGANPVTISSSATNAGQIEFTASSTSWNEQSDSGCIIENAVINQTVVSITDCSVKISDNIFNDAAGMMSENVAITTDGGSSTISNNNFKACGLDISDNSTISNNVIAGGIGVYGGSPVISDNTISGGSSYFGIGRDWDRDYFTVAIEDQSSPTLTGNTIDGSIAFNMNDNGYEYNIFNALITSNIIDGGIGIGGGSGSVVISNNIISGSTDGIIGNSAISTTINNNLIINNNIGLEIGDAIVQNNTIANNQIAITLNNAVSPTISGNNIENSSQYSIKLSSTSNNINASDNWWGTTGTQAINQTIYDFKYDFTLGNVTFVPFLTAPNTQSPTYITASAGAGGSIAPNGVLSLNCGGSQGFTITPNTGYYIVNVLVNGSSVGAVSSYVVQNIDGATTISASFALTPTPTPAPTPTPSPSPTPSPISTSASSATPTSTATSTPKPSSTATSEPTPTSTPKISEFPTLIILPLFAVVLLSIVFIRKRIPKK